MNQPEATPRPPATSRPRTVAIVLAAGDAIRFGGVKLLAQLDGRPLLQHVLDAVANAGIRDAVVVLGRAAPQVEAAIRWRAERRVINPAPERGLSSSLQLGIRAAAELDPAAEAALILLGDQPLVRATVIDGLLRAAAGDRPIVLPLYASDQGANPVLVRRDAWSLVESLTGDRGLGPVIARRPYLVRAVPFDGENPDVDEPSDLEALVPGGSRQ